MQMAEIGNEAVNMEIFQHFYGETDDEDQLKGFLLSQCVYYIKFVWEI